MTDYKEDEEIDGDCTCDSEYEYHSCPYKIEIEQSDTECTC